MKRFPCWIWSNKLQSSNTTAAQRKGQDQEHVLWGVKRGMDVMRRIGDTVDSIKSFRVRKALNEAITLGSSLLPLILALFLFMTLVVFPRQI